MKTQRKTTARELSYISHDFRWSFELSHWKKKEKHRGENDKFFF